MNTQIKTLMSQYIFNSNTCRILFATGFIALCLIALSTQAATITVTNTNDSGAGSLRQAIADANDGDTIEFGVTGTITLATGELLVPKSITINGPGSDNLTVDGNHASRVFHVSGGVTAAITALSITNGSISDNYGGGIYNDRSTLTVSDCTLTGNSAFSGGAMYNDAFTSSATLTVSNCTISGNVGSPAGAGIYSDGSYGSATMEIVNSTLSANSAGSVGGGIYNDHSTVTVSNCTLSGNSAGYGAGGIFNGGVSGSATLRVTNSTFSGNSAPLGAGIYTYGNYGSALLDVLNSTFSGNGIITVIATSQFGSTIFDASGISNSSGTISSIGYNLSSDDGGGFLTATGDQINTDPILGRLQDNGGPTFTHALLAGSPAIDAGDPNFDPNVFNPAMLYDQRGSGYDRIAHGRIDIGAFEVQTVAPSYAAQIQVPINPDGTSIFNVRRGVIPVKFTLTQGGVATCDLPPATIAVTRTGGGVMGQVNESAYGGNADTGSNFRIASCQYAYNLNPSALGVGIYRVDILINGQVVGSATFELR